MGNCNQPFALIKIRSHKTYRGVPGWSIIYRLTPPRRIENIGSLFCFLSVGLDFEEVKEDGGIVMDLVMGGIQQSDSRLSGDGVTQLSE